MQNTIDEKALAQLAVNGDSAALDKLVSANMGFVINLAKEYQCQGVELDDLVSEGSIALIMAIMKWDYNKTPRLVQYAVYDIRKAMEHVVEQMGNVVRVPEGADTKVKSMDAPLKQGHSRSLGESMPQKDARNAMDSTDDGTLSEDFELAFEILPEREKEVLRNYYGVGCHSLTMAEIGEKMGLKRERVRQIRKKAERRLRKLVDL